MEAGDKIPIKSVFAPEHIFLSLSSENKDEAIDLLVSLWLRSHHCPDQSLVLESVRERERKMSTGLKNGVAIPHGKIPGFGPSRGIIGVFPDGLDFDALDDMPVSIVFLFISDSDRQEQHLSVLRQISSLVDGNYAESAAVTGVVLDNILAYFR